MDNFPESMKSSKKNHNWKLELSIARGKYVAEVVFLPVKARFRQHFTRVDFEWNLIPAGKRIHMINKEESELIWFPNILDCKAKYENAGKRNSSPWRKHGQLYMSFRVTSEGFILFKQILFADIKQVAVRADERGRERWARRAKMTTSAREHF